MGATISAFKQGDYAAPTQCPITGSSKDCTVTGSYSECPVEPDHQAGFMVPSDFAGKFAPVNPDNKEAAPNQKPSPDQPFPLSTDRIVSGIPKAGKANENWVYPSPQMFWNAMIKKGWRWNSEDIGGSDMEEIINIHNNNNEDAWKAVVKWEKLRCGPTAHPKLKKFGGKAKQYTPKALMGYYFLGRQLPYDRHDWIIERDGKDVRYVIDYYYTHKNLGKRYPDLDVRPAFDSFDNIFDRVTVAWQKFSRVHPDWNED